MNNKTILVAIIALIIGGFGGYSIADKDRAYRFEGQNEEMRENIPAGMHRMPDGTMMGNVGTENDDMNQMGHMMAMTVSSEREFIEGMIPHHQEAVDTATEVIERGGSTPEIMQLVKAIVTAQEKETAEMKVWYETWYKEPYADNGEYAPMMRELSGLSGQDIDRAFLEDMIMHHMGAIMMAQSVQPYIEHEEIEELAQAIVSSQSKEIGEMRQMLRGL